jgi:hypothetical protein
MKDDKKKIIVLSALALVIVCVGVFQFALGGSPEPPPAVAKKTDKKDAAQQPAPEGPKNPEYVVNLPQRDPFQSQILPQMTPTPQPTPTPTPAPVRQVKEPTYRPMPGPEITGAGFDPGAKPIVVAVPEPKFAFMLSGVMLGEKPMAVFTDSQGGQRLVLLGGSLDPDSKVVSIERDAVTVKFHGKALRLTVEGNPNAK